MNGFPDDGDDLRTLLHDAVSDVHPEPALHRIRERTHGGSRVRRLRPVLVVSLAAATVAAIVGGITVANTRGGTSPADPGPSGPATIGGPTAAPSPSGTASSQSGFAPKAMAIYYAGDTPQGTRLYREFQQVLVSPVLIPVTGTVLRALSAPRPAGDQSPIDPDYRTLWPDGTRVSEARTSDSGAATVSLDNDALDLRARPAGMSEHDASLAIQQLVYTVQATEQNRQPVTFEIREKPARTLLGVDVSAPVPADPQLDVLALVNITEPAEGAEVSGSFSAHGVASSFEATVPWEIRRGSTVLKRGSSMSDGWIDKLYPWRTDPIDVSDLAPGSYTFVAATDDPTGGEGPGPTTDTRTIVVRR